MFSRILSVAVSLMIVITAMSVSAYSVTDSMFWNDSDTHILLEYGEESNCSINNAILKVKYDFNVNRIYMFYAITMDSFESVELSALCMEINSLGAVTVRGDGTAEYDDEVYFAESEIMFDKYTKTIVYEMTVGVKNGIPDKVNLSVYFDDSDGVRSNTFKADITPAAVTELSTESTVKTVKEKSTKAKKTQKSKTVKTKTETQVEETDESESREQVVVIGGDEPSNIGEDKTRVVILTAAGTSAAIAVIGAGCIAGIRKKIKSDKEKGVDKE